MADNPVTPPPPPNHSGHSDDDNYVERRSLRDYYIILRERIWIALPLALLVSVSIGYYQARETPMYQSTATMQFEKPETIVTTQGVVDSSVRSDIDLNTYLQLLTSNRLRTKVVESLTPDEIKILQRPYLQDLQPGASLPPPSALVGSVDINSIRNSFLISITARHRDPEGAALIAQRYVDQFLNYLLDNVSGSNDLAVEFLRERAEQLRKESEAKAQKLQDYMQQHNLISLDSSMSIVDDRLRTISGALTSSRLKRIDIESLSKQIEDFKRQGLNLLEISFIATHGTVPSLKNQLATLNQEQSRLAERYFERHPKMVDVANAIAVTEEQLNRAIDLAIADLATGFAEAKKNEQHLQEEYNQSEKKALELRGLRVDFESLKSDADVAKSNYMQILDRLNQTSTTKYMEKIPVRPLDRSQVPGSPYTPNIPRIIRTCVGIGFLVFFGVAIGLNYIDDRIKSAWDVENFIGVNLLGIIPDLSDIKDDDKYTLLMNDSQAPGSEAFLSVYSSVKIHSKLDFPKSILVTSTIPGEGKTLISCNLAGSFARHGRKALLIDCDLRRPMLHRHFKQQNTTGLMTWYEAGGSVDTNLESDPTLGIINIGENLSLLCSGGRSKSPTELLESPQFGNLLEKLKRQYDLVVVDSPPLGAVTDSLLIAERTDEVIYVCRFNRAYRKHIRLYIKALRNSKNEILGVVLNGLTPRRIEYYSNYRYYRSYKKYYGAQS
ncbi:MAG: polysaccharide biosynthesis tyrosine autokinase [Cephaloticoccus sp.]|nr:polysaccharide biosynthesis tyrosine autokinase [Cephaloticoccus sp.]MCF7760023.1 polysaccharide biosynthesis tyrosine autokinase [Cephaloticoccus sp.]